MKTRFRAVVACALCACVTGCAAPGESTSTNGAPTTVSAQNAWDVITIGISTRSDIAAALGKTTVINFDSGFEVWVYRYQGDASSRDGGTERNRVAVAENGVRGAAEFVVLLTPSGIVAKTRFRPIPPPGPW